MFGILVDKRLKRAALTHDIPAIESSKTEATARARVKIHQEEEKSPDCPDCFDTLMKLYYWDKVSYRCENCGLTIANPLLLFTMFEEHEIR